MRTMQQIQKRLKRNFTLLQPCVSAGVQASLQLRGDGGDGRKSVAPARSLDLMNHPAEGRPVSGMAKGRKRLHPVREFLQEHPDDGTHALVVPEFAHKRFRAVQWPVLGMNRFLHHGLQWSRTGHRGIQKTISKWNSNRKAKKSRPCTGRPPRFE